MFGRADASTIGREVERAVRTRGATAGAITLASALHSGAITKNEALGIYDNTVHFAVEDWDERLELMRIVASHIPLRYWERVPRGDGKAPRLKIWFHTEEWTATARTDANGRATSVAIRSVRREESVVDDIFRDIRENGW